MNSNQRAGEKSWFNDSFTESEYEMNEVIYEDVDAGNDENGPRYTEVETGNYENEARYAETETGNDENEVIYEEVETGNDENEVRNADIETENDQNKVRYAEVDIRNENRCRDDKTVNDVKKVKYAEIKNENDENEVRHETLEFEEKASKVGDTSRVDVLSEAELATVYEFAPNFLGNENNDIGDYAVESSIYENSDHMNIATTPKEGSCNENECQAKFEKNNSIVSIYDDIF